MVNTVERDSSDLQNFEFYNLVDLLRHRGEYQSRDIAFTFLPKGETEEGEQRDFVKTSAIAN